MKEVNVLSSSAFHGSVSKLDSAKEELGWLKVMFAIAAAIDASLIAWIAQTYGKTETTLVVGASIAAVVLTCLVIWINRLAYRRIRELENL